MVFSNRPSHTAGVTNPLRSVIAPLKALGPGAQFVAAGGVGLCGVLALGGLLAGDMLSAPVGIAALAYALAAGLALIALRHSYPHAAIGACNVVTLVRLMLSATLLAALLAPSPAPWPVFAIAVLAFALDGADGWLARRAGYASAFGARFDVEVDSALALILSLYAFFHAGVGAFVILLGLPRYLFMLARYPLPWLERDLPERFSRKVVCVVQIAALILILLPVFAGPPAGIVAGIAALALIWSFSADVRWLWKVRP